MDETFASDEKLYRGLHAIWIEEDDSVSSAAFKDSGGVSVDRDGGREEQNCIDRMVGALPNIIGIGRLTCGEVEDCGASPKYLPVEGNEFHSEIHDSAEQVQIKSRSKSRKLASKCQIVYNKNEQKKNLTLKDEALATE